MIISFQAQIFFKKSTSNTDMMRLHKPIQSSLVNRPTGFEENRISKHKRWPRLSLNYDGRFDKHTVGGLLLWEAQKRKSDNFFAQRDLVLPLPYIFAGVADGQQATMNSGADGLYENTNLALVGKVNYNFDSKYLAEFLFRYDGSSKFAKGSQWGFFPAASVGWRISEESFFRNASSVVIRH